MQFMESLRSAEDIVVDTVLWPIDMRRYLTMAFLPWRVHAEMMVEWSKPRAERFGGRLSPEMFWLLVVALPYFGLLDHYLLALGAGNISLTAVTSQPWPVRFVALVVILIAWPVSCSLLHCRRSRYAAAGRNTLRRLIATHCVAMAPASLLLLGALAASALLHERARNLNRGLCLAFLVASVYAETAIAIRESSPGWLDRIDMVWGCLSRSILHAICVIALGMGLIMAANGVFH